MNNTFLDNSPTPATSAGKPQEGRPALQRMECDQLKNLDRVLLMNWETIQQHQKDQELTQSAPNTPPTNQHPISGTPHCTDNNLRRSQPPENVNPYLLNQMGITPNAKTAHQAAQQRHNSPVIAYPVVPFWTGCPLPFSPMSYPQIVVPRVAMQYPVGPQLLRPVNYQAAPSAVSPQNVPLPQLNSQMTSQLKNSNTTKNPQREQALIKYRAKRARRTWSRQRQRQRQQQQQQHPHPSHQQHPHPPHQHQQHPHPQHPHPQPLQQNHAAQTIGGEAKPKFPVKDLNKVINQKVNMIKYEQEMEALKEKLKHSQHESMLLREKLLAVEKELNVLKNRQIYEDDMYRRTVFRNQVEASVPQWQPIAVNEKDQQGAIFDPFKPGHQPVAAFKQKIDLSQKRQDLRQINSPWLPADGDAIDEDNWEKQIEKLLVPESADQL